MIHKKDIGDKDFSDIISGKRTFVILRKGDEVSEDDLIAFNEYNEAEEHTGNSCVVIVDYITENHPFLVQNCVVASIKPCTVAKSFGSFNPATMETNYCVPYATGGFKDE
jgi:hypothetical protein